MSKRKQPQYGYYQRGTSVIKTYDKEKIDAELTEEIKEATENVADATEEDIVKMIEDILKKKV